MEESYAEFSNNPYYYLAETSNLSIVKVLQ